LPKLDPSLLADEPYEGLEGVSHPAPPPAPTHHAGSRALVSSQRSVSTSPEATSWLGPDVRVLQHADPLALDQLREALLSIRELLE